LPANVQALDDAKFSLFEHTHFIHPWRSSKKGEVWTADVGRSYRAMAYREGANFHWFWIGTHEVYNNLLSRFHVRLAGGPYNRVGRDTDM